MLILYNLGSIIGYHLIYFIFIVVAILVSKKIGVLGWVIYVVGTILEALSLIGNYKIMRYHGRVSTTFALTIMVGIGIAIAGASLLAVSASGATRTSKSSIKKLQQELEEEKSK